MVELHLAKVDVAGSNPVSRSRLYGPDFPGRFFFAILTAMHARSRPRGLVARIAIHRKGHTLG